MDGPFSFITTLYFQIIVQKFFSINHTIGILFNKIMKDKFCISSSSSFKQINNSQVNFSRTKQTFSFGKGSRFQEKKSPCPKATYGGDFQNKNPLGSVIGNGKRSDFTKCLTVSPSSTKYQKKSIWDLNKATGKGNTFGLSRDKVMNCSYISKDMLSKPSPDNYNNEKISRNKAPTYSLRKRTQIFNKKMTIQPQNTNPGPGSYENPQQRSISKSSNNISKFQNLSYGQGSSKRFQASQTLVPGPGNYNQIKMLEPKGKYVLSQTQGGTFGKFGQDRRVSMFDNKYKEGLTKPGPGYYKTPSEFGHYDGDQIYTEFRASKRGSNGFNNKSQRKVSKR